MGKKWHPKKKLWACNSNARLADTFNKSICLHYYILTMITLFKSNRFINYDFSISKKLKSERFKIFTPLSIFLPYKSALISI